MHEIVCLYSLVSSRIFGHASSMPGLDLRYSVADTPRETDAQTRNGDDDDAAAQTRTHEEGGGAEDGKIIVSCG